MLKSEAVMGGLYESREPRREPAWQPEPLQLPLDEPDTVTPEHQAEDQDTAEDRPGTHVVVIDLA